MLRAIRAGEVDAIVVNGGAAPAVYTLKSASDPYRQLIEQMSEGALTLSTEGVILYCNAAFARMIQRPREGLVGGLLSELIVPQMEQSQLTEFFDRTARGGQEIEFRADSGETSQAYVSSTFLRVDNEALHCLVVTDLTRQELRILHQAIVGSSPDAVLLIEGRRSDRKLERGGCGPFRLHRSRGDRQQRLHAFSSRTATASQRTTKACVARRNCARRLQLRRKKRQRS